jgi:C1A family cysteine protease
MRAAVVVCLLALASVSALRISEEVFQSEFTEFVAEFDKTYAVNEFFARYAIFKDNYESIVAHNTANHTWTMGVNQFSDLTAAEFEAIYLTGLTVPADYQPLPTGQQFQMAAGELDWGTKGAVGPVKNQGQCGSCWAFSTTGTIEGVYAIATKKIVSLSEQQLVDCSGSTGNQGCNGGWPKWALAYLISAGGSCSQADYPYTGRDGTCKKTCTPIVKVTGKVNEISTEAGLTPAIEIAPISIALAASSAFQSYKTGIFTGACPGQVNHAVLITGYGGAAPSEYWLVKNSWGAAWGEKGYIKLPRGQNKCNLGYASTYPSGTA